LLAAVSTAAVFTTPMLLLLPFARIWLIEPYEDIVISFAVALAIISGMLVLAICKSQPKWPLAMGFACSLIVPGLIICRDINSVNNITYYYRSVHLSNGISPLLPLIFLSVGLYIWSLQTLSGNRLLGEGRPRLPFINSVHWKYRAVGECGADRIDVIARPFSKWTPPIFAIACGSLIVIRCRFELPILSPEGKAYQFVLRGAVLLTLVLIVNGTAQLLWTWTELKQMLFQLGQLPLCRTFSALQRISARSLWTLSKNLPSRHFKLFSQQMNAVKRLRNECKLSVDDVLKLYSQRMATIGDAFSKDYVKQPHCAAQWRTPVTLKDGSRVRIRAQVASYAGSLMTLTILNSWEREALATEPWSENCEEPSNDDNATTSRKRP
jgi:hypothetical protein